MSKQEVANHKFSLPTVQEVPYRRAAPSLHDEAVSIARTVEPEELGLGARDFGQMTGKIESEVTHHGFGHANEVVDDLIHSVPEVEERTISVDENVLASGGIKLIVVKPRATRRRTRGAH